MTQATDALHHPRCLTLTPSAPARTPRPGDRVFRLDLPIVITIDGPAGTGKSTVARLLAQRLALDFLDTGAMYRAAALIAILRAIPPSDHLALVAAVEQADLRFDWSLDPPELLVFGDPVGNRIRRADVTAVVSPIAGIPALRRHMVARQRHIASLHPRLVTEGRDQGSVVFPEAKVKFYLDASPEVRARRRAAQLAAAGLSADEARLLEEITQRDRSDMGRSDGPLIRPQGAIVLDTSPLSMEQVVDELERIVRRKAAEP
jgi:CMP/dCMP kinase